jgi:hypothetical protein
MYIAALFQLGGALLPVPLRRIATALIAAAGLLLTPVAAPSEPAKALLLWM